MKKEAGREEEKKKKKEERKEWGGPDLVDGGGIGYMLWYGIYTYTYISKYIFPYLCLL